MSSAMAWSSIPKRNRGKETRSLPSRCVSKLNADSARFRCNSQSKKAGCCPTRKKGPTYCFLVRPDGIGNYYKAQVGPQGFSTRLRLRVCGRGLGPRFQQRPRSRMQRAATDPGQAGGHETARSAVAAAHLWRRQRSRAPAGPNQRPAAGAVPAAIRDRAYAGGPGHYRSTA